MNVNAKRSRSEILNNNDEAIDNDILLIARIMERRKEKEGNQTNCFDMYQAADG